MRRNALLLLVLLVLPWLGCAKGQECDVCSSDDDCKQGFVWQQLQRRQQALRHASARPTRRVR
jgi:hypothetical protein